MKKLSQVLLESQNTRKQIRGSLIKKDGDDIVAYCALGALACEAGLQFDDNGHVHYEDIIHEYGVNINTLVAMPSGNDIWEGHILKIPHAIYRLNDSYMWSFKKIGEWLKKLEDEGTIK